MLSVCRLDKIITCQVIEQAMIIVMTIKWSSSQLRKEEKKTKSYEDQGKGIA